MGGGHSNMEGRQKYSKKGAGAGNFASNPGMKSSNLDNFPHEGKMSSQPVQPPPYEKEAPEPTHAYNPAKQPDDFMAQQQYFSNHMYPNSKAGSDRQQPYHQAPLQSS